MLTPAIGLLRFPSSPPRTDDTDAGREAASVFQRDAGRLAFCARYIEAPRAEAATLRRPGRPNVQTQGDAIRLFALDAFLWHYDRSAKNPNALLLEHRLVAVDHDRSFHRVHDIEESGLGPDFGGVGDAEGLREHIAFDVARNHRTHDAWRGFIEAIGKLSPTEITSLAQSWPAELDVTATGDRAGRVDDLIRFLSLRCASVATIVGEIQDALA